MDWHPVPPRRREGEICRPQCPHVCAHLKPQWLYALRSVLLGAFPFTDGDLGLTQQFPPSRVAHTPYTSTFSPSCRPVGGDARGFWSRPPLLPSQALLATTMWGQVLVTQVASICCLEPEAPGVLPSSALQSGGPFVQGPWQEPRNAKYLQVTFSQNAF